MSRVVFKLGGSLLTCKNLPQRLRGLLRQRSADDVLIVVGGGAAADVVRDWSRRYCLPEESAHWIALRSLSLTRSLVKRLLPECMEVASFEEALSRWTVTRTPLLLDVEAFLSQAESVDPEPLPHLWDVTTDSIAAWVASRWSADELVLLKSTGLEGGADLESAVCRELVDAHFPKVAGSLSRIHWCNLLEESPQVQTWLEFGKPVGAVISNRRSERL